MAFLRSMVGLVALVGLGAASLQAQSRRAHVIAAPQGRARIASIAPPPPPPRDNDRYGETVFRNPVIVTADGRMLVDLGNGYEPVARTCPDAYGYACPSYGYPPQPPVLDYGLPIYVPPQYAAPAYGTVIYPVPVYPQGGYIVYSVVPQAGYVPNYQPPTIYGGCPGSYSSCGHPSIGRTVNVTRLSGAVQAAPRRPTTAVVLPPRIVRR
jgi:hypothetical protein